MPVEELLDADEVFCTGTAVVVSPVGSITYLGKRLFLYLRFYKLFMIDYQSARFYHISEITKIMLTLIGIIFYFLSSPYSRLLFVWGRGLVGWCFKSCHLVTCIWPNEKPGYEWYVVLKLELHSVRIAWVILVTWCAWWRLRVWFTDLSRALRIALFSAYSFLNIISDDGQALLLELLYFRANAW